MLNKVILSPDFSAILANPSGNKGACQMFDRNKLIKDFSAICKDSNENIKAAANQISPEQIDPSERLVELGLLPLNIRHYLIHVESESIKYNKVVSRGSVHSYHHPTLANQQYYLVFYLREYIQIVFEKIFIQIDESLGDICIMKDWTVIQLLK